MSFLQDKLWRFPLKNLKKKLSYKARYHAESHFVDIAKIHFTYRGINNLVLTTKPMNRSEVQGDIDILNKKD